LIPLSNTSNDFIQSGNCCNNAEKLGHNPHRWESTTTGKCNAFVDAVYCKVHIPLPWDEAHVPDCHGMREALDKECQKPHSHWHKVYVYDSVHGTDSDNRFEKYHPKNGDIILWDGRFGDQQVQHSGIAVEPYDIKYAGARDEKGKPPKHGIGKTGIENFTQHKPYGSPTAVYRYDDSE
jgi:hypothetical protein